MSERRISERLGSRRRFITSASGRADRRLPTTSNYKWKEVKEEERKLLEKGLESGVLRQN